MTMNSVAAFDDRVCKGLASLRLCFLSGIHISDETLAYVAKLVRENGLTVVTPKRFAPAHIRKKAKKRYSEVADGKGLWIVTDRISSNGFKKRIAPFTGNKGEIRLTFEGGKEIKLKIAKDGDSFKVM